MKKLIIGLGSGLLIAIFLFPSITQAQTTAEQLQQLINSLQAQVLQLQSQLNSVQGTTTSTVGDVSVVTASDDSESGAGIIIGGTQSVLAKFAVMAANEDMTVNRMQILVSPYNNANATSSEAVDEVPRIRLYDGTTLIGSSTGYVVTPFGGNAGIVFVSGLNWVIPANATKTLTVKGDFGIVSPGAADTGASVYAHVMSQGFQACGASGCDTNIFPASGKQKLVYKSKPSLSKIVDPSLVLQAGTAIPVFKFRVAADSAGDVKFKKLQFLVSMVGATMSAASMTNVQLDDIATGTNLAKSAVYSGASVASSTQAPIRGGESGFVTIELTNAERITAGAQKDYRLKLSFSNLVPAPNACAAVRLTQQVTTAANGAPYSVIEGAPVANDGIPSFIWSDISSIVGTSTHSELNPDWANGKYVRVFDEAETSLVCNGATNNPPYITNVTGPSTLLANMSGTWTITATDQDGNLNLLTVSWGDNTSSTRAVSGASTTQSFNHSYSTVGLKTIIFKVYDTSGLSDTEVVTVNVRSVTPTYSKLPIEGSLIKSAQQQLSEMTAKIYEIVRQLGL